MLIRAVIERKLVGLPDLVPLNYENFQQSLGPGYKMHYFTFSGLRDRQKDCIAPSNETNPNEERRKRLLSNPGASLAEFMNRIAAEGYHEGGHLAISRCGGPMAYSEASARDPTFWRWHRHVSDFIETTLDTKILPAG